MTCEDCLFFKLTRGSRDWHGLQLEPDDGVKCTVWFESESMLPLRAEIASGGRVPDGHIGVTGAEVDVVAVLLKPA